MPRAKRFNHARHRARKHYYQSLRLEENIQKLKAQRRARLPEDLSDTEAQLIHDLTVLRHSARFEAMELELYNHQRAMAGLPPLKSVPPDTPQSRSLLRLEREMAGMLGRL
ncbi:hypothetical protein DES40_1137 [Litorimonas taeanensis]|uniref:Uncharacterized protein n=1 Tax=Litorimonas taeanensis TaxID=568099 RepID=A0A420WLA9_9PROT|nr:hypothetical protein [Litorimonas taeanensis]RKQ71807.1 hypothetical protein DES40_1137 [Litorimonas taeanensis]